MVYQIVAVHKDGMSENKERDAVNTQVLIDGRKQLGEFIYLSGDSVSLKYILNPWYIFL